MLFFQIRGQEEEADPRQEPKADLPGSAFRGGEQGESRKGAALQEQLLRRGRQKGPAGLSTGSEAGEPGVRLVPEAAPGDDRSVRRVEAGQGLGREGDENRVELAAESDGRSGQHRRPLGARSRVLPAVAEAARV